MPEAAHPLSQRFEPAPRRSWTWALPLALALALVGSVAAWLQLSDTLDRESAQQSLISDALSLEQQLRVRIETEQARLDQVAHLIAAGRLRPDGFAAASEVIGGLRRRWLSIIWLDKDARVVAQAPADLAAATRDEAERRGLSAHIVTQIAGYDGENHGQLIVRYALSALLAQETPWWIAQRHVVRLVDGFDEQLATTAAPGEQVRGAAHRISFAPPFNDVYLELQARRELQPWYRGWPLAIVLGVLALLGWATYLTWRQAHGVALAEAAWRGEAAWRRAMEDALTVGLRARDMVGRLLYVNRRLCELTGFSEQELVGRAPPMPYWPPDEIEQVMQRHLRNMAGGAPSEGYESRWRSKDGREIVVMLLEAPLIDPSGRQIGWLGSVVDITERRRAEELERRRAERAAYQARLMTLGEIAASLAHELNQPLAAITSYGAGVRNALAGVPGIDARVLQALERQGEQAAAAARIVERIRAFLSRRAPQQERCDLRAIVDNAALLLRPDLRRRGVEFTVELPAGPPGEALLLDADPVLLEQVLVNLVRNAADALDGRPAPRTVSVRAGADDGTVWFEVRDNGAGLGGRSIGELTAPFYSTKTEGMGLGLAICRSIVEAHVGELSAADHPAGGASFRVRLPRAAAAQPAPAAAVESVR